MSRSYKYVVFAFLLSSFLALTPVGYAQSWISAVNAIPSNTGAVLTWVTSVPATTQLRYGTTLAYGTHSRLDPTLTTTHSATLASLLPNTLYHVRILSADGTGAVVTSLDYTFNTLSGTVSVTVSPTSASVSSGGSQQFSAQVINTSNQSVTWSTTGGTVSSSGLFTAPVVTSNTAITLTATAVADPTKSACASITVSAPFLNVSPASLAFGNVQVGASSYLNVTLTNPAASSVTVSQANLAGSGFSISGISVPLTLTANQSVTFQASFSPKTSGPFTGSLAIVSNAGNSPLAVPLSGAGAAQGQLAISPAALNFGNVLVGQSAALSGTLTASTAPVTITSGGINNNEYVLSGIALPVTIPVGQSVPFTVTFLPQASGTASASLAFTSNALNTPTNETLTGNGTVPQPHSVALTWNPSTGAIGYNIYRASNCASYQMINSGLDSSTTYTDNSVSAGQSYCYVVTAVNASQGESGYSNQAPAQVPSP